MKLDFFGLTYLALGALFYWLMWGNPDGASIIPFIAFIFLYPLYFAWKVAAFVAFWAMVLIGLGVAWLVGYIMYEKITKKRRLNQKLRAEGYIK